MGPGAGSITLASLITTTLVRDFSQTGGNTVLSSTTFTAPVTFSKTGLTSTIEVGGGAPDTLIEVGTLTVFNQTGGGAPVVQGDFVVQEGLSSLSLTRTTPSETIQLAGIGSPADHAALFTLTMPNGMTLHLTAAVTDEGVLVITAPDSTGTIDLSQVVMMGMMIMKNEQNLDIGILKAVLLQQR